MNAKSCPIHGLMASCTTRYGLRWACTAPGCTVVCWDRPTATPADQATRDARRMLHDRFDPLWRDPAGPFSRNSHGYNERRTRAYHWLRQKMNLGADETHIGMFDLDRCRHADEAITQLMQQQQRRQQRRKAKNPHGSFS